MKYKTGDRIREKDTGWVGTVIGIDKNGSWNILVAYDENEEIKGDNERYVREENIEFINKRQAFLEGLKELLDKFDAKLYVHGYGNVYAKIDDMVVFFGNSEITRDNVMDYEK